MAKDIKNDDLLEWDTYIGKSAEKTLPEIYKHAKNLSIKARGWYWASIKSKRRFSLGIRTIILIFLVCGGVLPVIAGSLEETKLRLLFTQYGVAALAVAGLLQVADRIFGFSSGWIRYISTVLAMEDLTRKFELDWADYLLCKNQNIGDDDKRPLFDLAKKFEEEILRKQIEETEKWVAEFNNANTLLSELIKSQRETAEKIYSEEKERSEKKKKEQAEAEVGNTIVFSEADLVNMAIAQYKSYFISKGNVRTLMPGKKINEKGYLVDCLTIHLKDDNRSGIPDQLTVKLPNSTEKQVEIEIIEEVEKPTISYYSGDSIANQKSNDFKGSVACRIKLKNSTECLLTCSHVMTNGISLNANGFFSNTEDTVINRIDDGKWFYGLLNEEFDIALIKDFDNSNFSYINRQKLNEVRELSEDDIKNTKVKMIGRRDFYDQNIIEGFIINHRAYLPITIRYNGGHDISFINLIVISNSISKPYQSISKKGDSGSLVIDDKMNPIGIVIADNSKFTYAIALPKILNKLNAQII